MFNVFGMTTSHFDTFSWVINSNYKFIIDFGITPFTESFVYEGECYMKLGESSWFIAKHDYYEYHQELAKTLTLIGPTNHKNASHLSDNSQTRC